MLACVGLGAVGWPPGVTSGPLEGLCGRATLDLTHTEKASASVAAKLAVHRLWRSFTRSRIPNLSAASLPVVTSSLESRNPNPACLCRSVIRCRRLSLGGFQLLLQLGALLRSQHFIDLGHRTSVQFLHLCFLLVFRQRGIVEDGLAL